MKHVVNFGAGVNSTAMIFEMVRKGMPIDFVVFADTGSEMPETYQHIERMREWFKQKGIEFITVQSKYDKTIYDYYHDKRTIPFRMTRDCTEKFKKVPITKFIKQFKDEGVTQYIGIGYEELHRMRTSDVSWITFEYPLVDWKIDRNKCLRIIAAEGFEQPVKSGCFFCPFQSHQSWVNLLNKHPELFAQSRRIEEDNRSYPKNALPFQHNLKIIETAQKEQTTLKIFVGDAVCGGFCMT